ncbi:hypothetical protein [Alkaliphilus crotonatoxidans]
MQRDHQECDKAKNPRKCGVYTCIHCVVNTCMLDECDMFERKFVQEG